MAGPEMVWITAQPRNPATGAVTTVRLAGGGRSAPYRHPVSGEQHRAGVVGRPRFKAALDFGDDGWTGRTVPTTGNLDFKPAQATLLDQLGGLYWKDAALLVEVGPEGGAVSTLLNGTVKNGAASLAGLLLEVADLSVALDKPLATAKFAGDGGIEGGEEAAGRVKRRSWGRVFNVEGRVLDKANNIYEFGDPAFKLQAISPLRDMGRSAAPEPSIVTWQGSAAATLTALKAATCAEGSGVVAPSIACAKWWTQPAGPLTADLLGEIGAGYVETAPEIAARISGAMTGPAITNTAAMALLRPDPAGIHIGDGSETAAAALDRLCLGVSLLWVLLPAGTIQLREQTFSAPVETLISHSVTRKKAIAPVGTRRVGWSKSHRIHSDAEISTAIDAAFVQPGPPAAWQMTPGSIWLDSDDGYRAHERVAGSGYLEDKDGNAVLDADGHEIEAALIAATDQRLRDAYDLALAAVARLTAIDDDGTIDKKEKADKLKPDIAGLEAALDVLDPLADDLGITTELTAALDAWNDVTDFLDSLTPPWDDINQDTPVDRGALDAVLLAFKSALETLRVAVGKANAGYTFDLSAAALTVMGNYGGAPKVGQLPKTVTVTLKQGLTNVTSAATITIDAESACDASITGAVASLDDVTASGYFDIRAEHGDFSEARRVSVTFVPDQSPPPAGTVSQSTTTMPSVSSTGYPSDPNVILEVEADGSGEIECTVSVNYTPPTPGTLATNTLTLSGKGVYRPEATGGAWSNFPDPDGGGDNEKDGTASSATRFEIAPGEQETSQTTGVLNFTVTATGLTPGTLYEVGLMLRRSGGSYTTALTPSGSATFRQPGA